MQDLIYWAGEALSLSLWTGCMIFYTWPSKRQEALWYPISCMILYKSSLSFECSSHLPLISLLFVLHRHSSNKCFTYVIFIDIYSLKDLGPHTHTHTHTHVHTHTLIELYDRLNGDIYTWLHSYFSNIRKFLQL